jgi:hypothetical protein
MPTPTYIALATTTLGSAASSVTFSSIPATYKDLVLIVNARNSSVDAGIRVRFNSDAASNYSFVTMRGNGSTATSSSSTTDFVPGVDAFTAQGSMGVYQIMDYSATDKHKTVLVRGGYAADDTKAAAVRWANTSAITSIGFTMASGNFTSGSTFSLYGVA